MDTAAAPTPSTEPTEPTGPTPVTPPASPVKGSAVVRVFSSADVVERLCAARTALLESAHTQDTAAAVAAAQRWELDADGTAAFRTLERMGFLGGLPAPACCATHDEDRTAAFVAAVDDVAATHALPAQPAR